MGRASRKNKGKASRPGGQAGPYETTTASNRIEALITGKYSALFALLFIAVSVLLSYSNTFHSSFQLDDIRIIVDNESFRSLGNMWPPSGNRYVGSLTFALNYHFGSTEVWGYHLVNTLIHIANGMILWWLVLLVFSTPALCDSAPFGIKANRLRFHIALLTSVLFVTHPIQTEAVTYIVQRFASLATLFYLLSLSLYIKGRLSEDRWRTAALVFGAFIAAVLAMKTKEISFTLPFVILLAEFFFFKGRGGILARLPALVPMLATLVIIPLGIIGTDKPIGEMLGELKGAAQETESISRGDYLLTQFRVIVTYIRLLLVPVNQNLDYGFEHSSSLGEPAVILSLILLLMLFTLAVYLFVRSKKSGNAYPLLISFGIIYFFVTLSVESSIIPIKDVIFEHRLYLPSAGAFLSVSAVIYYGFFRLGERLEKKVSVSVFTVVMVLLSSLVFGTATHLRNRVWHDDITLWEDVVEKTPNKSRGFYNLGVAYAERGRYKEAIELYEYALRLQPTGHAYYNLGNIYTEMGKIEDAIFAYEKAAKLLPNYERIFNNLGVAYSKLNDYESALKYYNKAIEIKPDFTDALNNIGVVYDDTGDLKRAMIYYRRVVSLDPDFSEAYNNLGVVYFKLGRLDESVEVLRRAIELNAGYANSHANLALALYKAGNGDEAIRHLRTTLRLEPSHPWAGRLLEKLEGDSRGGGKGRSAR